MKPKLDKCVKILNKNIYYYIIEAPQKRFYTMGKYISDDMFASMTASRSTRAVAVRFIISLGLLLDPVLPS